MESGEQAGRGRWWFYTLAKQLGLFDGGDEQEFLQDQHQKVYDTWKVVIKTKE